MERTAIAHVRLYHPWENAAPDDLVQHVAPLGWNHISLTGDYLWSEINIPSDGFRPLNTIDEAA